MTSGFGSGSTFRTSVNIWACLKLDVGILISLSKIYQYNTIQGIPHCDVNHHDTKCRDVNGTTL